MHEHHSFSDDRSAAADVAEREVRALHERWYAQSAAKDLDGMMIHQHVPFPFDPETGAARTDLRP